MYLNKVRQMRSKLKYTVVIYNMIFLLWRHTGKKEQEKKEAKQKAEMNEPENEPLSPLQCKNMTIKKNH